MMLRMKHIFSLLFAISIAQGTIKKAHLDSNWYPNEKTSLQKTVSKLSDKAAQLYDATVDSRSIRALIVPHAGYRYSGTVAASVYRLLDKSDIKKIIILAPDHSVSFQGVAVPSFDQYHTPLSNIPVNTEIIKKLENQPFFIKNDTVFDIEHSLEMQLPLIQTYCAQATIVPLIVGKLTCAQAHAIAQALKSVIDDRTLVIVSSDFTHYGSRFGFGLPQLLRSEQYRTKPVKQEYIHHFIRSLDSQAIQTIEHGSCSAFEKFMESTGATICGHYPLEIFLSLLELNAFGSVEPRLIAYDTSGNQEKNQTSSVSYVGMLFTSQKLVSQPFETQLTQQEQRGLWQEAHDVLFNIFAHAIDDRLLYPILSFGVRQKHGAFTTLDTVTTRGKQLRGCIGRITTPEPLYKTVATVMRDTALHDTRFNPITKNELPNLSLKLSILSDPHPITSYKNIVLGKHGIILSHGLASAVFLPEVPVEFKWNLPETLTQLSEKAGLPSNAWQDKTAQFEVFTSIDIGEM